MARVSLPGSAPSNHGYRFHLHTLYLALPRDINVHLPKRTRVPVPLAKCDTVILVAVLDLEVVRLGTPRARPVDGADFGVTVIDVTRIHEMSKDRQAAVRK